MRFISTLGAIALLGLVAAQTDDSTSTRTRDSETTTTEDSSSGTGSPFDGGDVCPSGGDVYRSYCCVGTLLSTKGAAAASATGGNDNDDDSDSNGSGGGGGGISSTLPHVQGSAKVPIPVKSQAPPKRNAAAPASGRAKSMSHTLSDGAVCVGTLITLGFSSGGSGAAATTSSAARSSSTPGPLASLGAAASTTTSSDESSSTTESATSSSSTGMAAGSFGEVRVAALLGAGVGVGVGMGMM